MYLATLTCPAGTVFLFPPDCPFLAFMAEEFESVDCPSVHDDYINNKAGSLSRFKSNFVSLYNIQAF